MTIENYKPTVVMMTDAKILNKIVVNQIQLWITITIIIMHHDQVKFTSGMQV